MSSKTPSGRFFNPDRAYHSPPQEFDNAMSRVVVAKIPRGGGTPQFYGSQQYARTCATQQPGGVKGGQYRIPPPKKLGPDA
jgi:hypothetical protein